MKISKFYLLLHTKPKFIEGKNKFLPVYLFKDWVYTFLLAESALVKKASFPSEVKWTRIYLASDITRVLLFPWVKIEMNFGMKIFSTSSSNHGGWEFCCTKVELIVLLGKCTRRLDTRRTKPTTKKISRDRQIQWWLLQDALSPTSFQS